jgi:serine/threonine protein kinase/Tfp pilus assembly protein PilF
VRAEDHPEPTLRIPVVARSHTALAPPADPVGTPPPASLKRLSNSFLADAEHDDPCADFPKVGDTFLGFHLVDELGQGAFARVFLAHQESLAGRPVALKVTLRHTREAERLARLQHTNVVPVYSTHDTPPLQVICMPFLGRQTIAHLIRAYRSEHASRGFPSRRHSNTRPARTTAVPDSRHSGAKLPPALPGQRPPLPVAADARELIGDPRAVLRVLAQLAAGLAHAHAHGILHLDLKPANVLLPDLGEPMLLDFNLSFDSAAAERELVGGTIPYMAIEQLHDLKSRGGGCLDARTDLYSLGVMAFEMLTGVVPFPAASASLGDLDALIAARKAGPPPLRKLNPEVTPAVEAIVRKLLAPHPADRYQTADQLRADVERHLNDLPLAFAHEPSPAERFAKWRRRNPGVLLRLTAASVLGLALGLAGLAYQEAEANARTAAVEKVRSTRGALNAVRMDLIVPGDSTARDRGIAKAEELLAAYGLPGERDWMSRPDVARLLEPDRAALGGDLGELLLLLAQAKWDAGRAKTGPERREAAELALALNRAAGRCFPADAAPRLLNTQEIELAAAAGQPPPAELQYPEGGRRAARDLFLEGAAGIAHGRFAAALPLFEQAVAENPGHAVAHFCLAYCRQQFGKYEAALERYETAAVLMPGDPRPALFRGLVFRLTLKPADADAEFTRALKLDPGNAEAYWNRGLVRYRRSQLKEAAADFAAAIEKGMPAYSPRTLLARLHEALGDKAAAEADRAALAELEPKSERDYLVRGVARLDADPKGALEDFRTGAELNPRSVIALQNQAHVLAEKLDDLDGALAAITRATDLFPEFAPARAGRAVVLARLGKRDEAHVEIEKARLVSKDAGITYKAACVYALTSKTHLDDQTKSLKLLREAYHDGYHDLKMLAKDPDLDPVRRLQEFGAIAAAAEVFKLQ